MKSPTYLDISPQERAAVFSRVRRFAFAVQQLGQHGLNDKAPVLVQPAMLLALGNLAQHANAYMGATSPFEQVQHLARIERSIRECDELQSEADRQLREQQTAKGEHSE